MVASSLQEYLIGNRLAHRGRASLPTTRGATPLRYMHAFFGVQSLARSGTLTSLQVGVPGCRGNGDSPGLATGRVAPFAARLTGPFGRADPTGLSPVPALLGDPTCDVLVPIAADLSSVIGRRGGARVASMWFARPECQTSVDAACATTYRAVPHSMAIEDFTDPGIRRARSLSADIKGLDRSARSSSSVHPPSLPPEPPSPTAPPLRRERGERLPRARREPVGEDAARPGSSTLRHETSNSEHSDAHREHRSLVEVDSAHSHQSAQGGGVLRSILGAGVLAIVMAGAWLTAPPIVVPGSAGTPDDLAFETVEGIVESAIADPPGAPGGWIHQVRLTSGVRTGERATVTLQAPSIPLRPGAAPSYRPGDRVVLSYRAEDSISDGPASGEPYQIVDRVRRPWLWAGVLLIAVVASVVSGWQGLRAMVGLGVAAWMIWWLVVPRILAGQDPVLVALAGCVAIAVPALVLTHGIGREAFVPLVGMAGSLALAGGTSAVAVRAAALTGLAANEEIHLVHAALRGEIDTRGLLLASMLLGAVGGLIDVTVAQSAAVFEFASTGYIHTRAELFWRGMAVGRAHVVAAVHTLVLAYAGAALPTLLLLALYAPQLGDIWNREIIAAELLRAVTGIVGLGAAMPLTTWIAARTARLGLRRD